MASFVADIEADNLIDDVTKIHCLSYTPTSHFEPKTLTSYDEIRKFLSQENLTLIGHQFVRYDVPVLEKILGMKVDARIVDTLGISYYINSSNGRVKHGLEQYGEEYGVLKPKIDDWENQSLSDYIVRCETDININFLLWKDQQAYLKELYNNDTKEILRVIDYITFKMDCLKEQDENRIPVDVGLVVDEIIRLEGLVQEKRKALLAVMPEVVKYKTVTKPKKLYKDNGEISVAGNKWNTLLQENGYSSDSEISEIEVVDYREEANPDSTTQIKSWLFSLNWNPIHYKFVRNKATNEVKQIPQINSENDNTEICPSIVELAEEVPELQHLAGYSTVKHRLTIFKGFVRDMDRNNMLVGDAMGWTNTMRLKHRILVNLPKPTAPYAENIRACLIAPEGYYMVGTDVQSVEDSSKQSYIYPFDPEYVDSMRSEGFDPHLDIAVRAGLLTQEQADDHTNGVANYKEERAKAKTVNFASLYKCGAKTLARNMKTTEKAAKKILDAYWERNKALKQFEDSCETKTVSGQLWVKQPVSGFWYSLRYTKDIFSTVNQSTAVYIFDTWVKYMRALGLIISGQWHDEAVLLIKNNTPQENTKETIQTAMTMANDELKLNVTIGCSIDVGQNYKDVH